MTSAVSLEGIHKRYGTQHTIRNVSIDVQPGEFMTLVGPSGCGKSTLLRVIAGLVRADAGVVRIAGKVVDDLPPAARDIAMVFQNYALYPHLSVYDNIAAPLRLRRLPRRFRLPFAQSIAPQARAAIRAIHDDVIQAAQQAQIEMLLDRKPAQLSGGQRQRVALARAMVRQPRVFLMDEPLSNLDARLRVHMREELTDLHRKLGATFIYVTHDQTEAMTMSTRVALMLDGAIIQVGTPMEVHDDPASLAAAQFLGTPEINVLDGTVNQRGELAIEGVPSGTALEAVAAGPLRIAFRPQSARLQRAALRGISLGAQLVRSEAVGRDVTLHAKRAQGARVCVQTTRDDIGASGLDVAGGSDVRFQVPLEDVFLFDSEGRRIRQPLRMAGAA